MFRCQNMSRRNYAHRRMPKSMRDRSNSLGTLLMPFWKGKSLDWWKLRLEKPENEYIKEQVLVNTVNILVKAEAMTEDEAINVKSMIESDDLDNVLLAVGVIEYKLKK